MRIAFIIFFSLIAMTGGGLIAYDVFVRSPRKRREKEEEHDAFFGDDSDDEPTPEQRQLFEDVAIEARQRLVNDGVVELDEEEEQGMTLEREAEILAGTELPVQVQPLPRPDKPPPAVVGLGSTGVGVRRAGSEAMTLGDEPTEEHGAVDAGSEELIVIDEHHYSGPVGDPEILVRTTDNPAVKLLQTHIATLQGKRESTPYGNPQGKEGYRKAIDDEIEDLTDIIAELEKGAN